MSVKHRSRWQTSSHLHPIPILFAVLAGAALSGAGCTSEGEDCISDRDCPTDTYCKSLICVTPSAEGDLADVYRERIVPLLETGCNCHGPGTERPWAFDHRDAVTSEASLTLLRNWMYNPWTEWKAAGEPDAEVPPPDRFALIGYAVAECGYRHPQIWPPGAAQLRELELFFARAYDAIERPGRPDATIPLVPKGPLPPYEAGLFEALEALAGDDSLPRALGAFNDRDAALEARLAGQCGCCHVTPRSLRIPPIDPKAPVPEAVARRETFLCDQGGRFPAGLAFGLGLSIAPVQHPIVYRSADEGRYGLLYRWFELLAARAPVDADGRPKPISTVPPCADAGPDVGPDDPGDAGPEGGVDVGPAVVAALEEYTEAHGPMLARRCGSGPGCHQEVNNRWYHVWPLAAGDRDARDNIDRMGSYLDRADPEGSILVQRGQGVAHAFYADGFAGDGPAFFEWMRALPPEL